MSNDINQIKAKTMKQLFRHTSTLLRTVLLFGVFSFVNTQSKAQTPEQWAAMPDAFETMDPASIIGDGNYYYIQFYTSQHDICSYLTDCGVNKMAATKDFLPYANNRLWTLESAGDDNATHFILRNKAGHYISFGRFENKDRVGCVDNSGAASILTFNNLGDGYDISAAANSDYPMFRNGPGQEWATELPYNVTRRGSYADHTRLRFAKLKSNAAFIIYYRDGGADNSDPSASTIRHYLTYSDVDAASTVMASAVTNGSLEGADASSFFFGDPDHDDPFVASITDGAGNNGSRGIQITARGKASPNDWDTQFFISADEVIPEGTTFHLEFDYRANRNATVPTQAHSAPGSYITEMPNINGIRNLSFTTDWQHYSADIEVSHVMGYGGNNDKGNSFQTIAFNLWRDRSTDPNTIYYFDNIKLTVPTSGSAVSSRRSIIPPDKPLSTLPTIAAYHQDGLWQLEEASADGKFYIKKYDSNEYLNCDLADPYAAAFAVLGPKDETHGQYSLVDPVASRYTLVQNVQYQTAALSPDMFYHWDGYGADASIDGQHGDVDFNYQLGTQLGSGGTVAGTGGVDYVRYADLTNYTTMIVKGTPGMVVRVLMNRQESNSGPLTERTLTIGNDGKVELDLTDIKNDAGYVHLNAIKIGWGNSGAITDVELVNQNQVNTSSPLYLNHSNGDGYPVMERNDDAANHWYAAFYPVEVPVPNKDDFFQVLVKWGDNMIDHNGNSIALPADVSDYDLWQLEQVDDYLHFRLKDPNGRYLRPWPNGTTEPNNPEGAEINTNKKFWTDFALTWYYVNPVPKEIPVDYMITHRMSYLKDYTTQYQGLELDRQGLTTDADSYWWNNDSKTQKVNHFEITHYVKQGQTITVPLPTILNASNDHVYYQRWYHYNDETCDNETYPDGTDLEGLKSHLRIDSRDDGDVQYFLYKNGMVTGQKLDWTGINQSSYKRNVQRNFYFTNSDGKAFTVAADVSRYSDFTYENESNHLQGDLEEPSLTMRYIYYMRDAKTMAAQLTACAPGTDKWLETKTFHFPARQIFYESQKKAGYRGEFIGLRHLFSDYWVFENSSYADAYNEGIAYNSEHPEDQRDLTYLDEYLRSAVTSKSSGRIEVEIVDDATYPTGIRKGGWNPNIDRYGFADGNDADYEGFYFYDMMDFNNVTDAKASYGDSRFIVFRYPASRMVNVPTDPNVKQEAKINVYLNYNGTKYQLAQFTIIFDPGTVTLPYKQINGTSPYVLDNDFKDRDPKALVDKAGEPIAKVTFDYPTGDKYHFPAKGSTKQGWWEAPADASIDNSSPIPLIFDKTNYAYMGFECNWGSYSIVTQMTTNYGNHQNAMPANDNTYGYGHADYPALQADPYLQNGFLYIDASEQPGDICSAPFVGDFCAGDKLMFSGWISGSNKAGGGDNRCPGGITLTVKGEHKVNGKMQTETLYRFCPGQIYELDNNTGTPDGSGVDGEQWLKNAQGQYIDNNGNVVDEEHRVPNPNYDNNKYYVVWQQFYFEFVVTDKYDRHWIEVNNNCVSSKGGDFMLDNIEVYAIVPDVVPKVNTPLCISVDENGEKVTDLRLLKLSVNFNKLESTLNINETSTDVKNELGVVFLDKYKFLETFRNQLRTLTTEEKHHYALDEYNFNTISLDELAEAIETGKLKAIEGNNEMYQDAFDEALVGDHELWHSSRPNDNKHAAVMYFEWHSQFDQMPTYSYRDAVNKTSPVYGETINGERWLVMNGNYPELEWKTNTDYYILISNVEVDESHGVTYYNLFNICSDCSKPTDFRIESPLTLLGLDKSEDMHDYVVCEGQIPTLVTELKGYDFNGNEVPMQGVNYDWWLGDKANGVLPTLDNYHTQSKIVDGQTVRLDQALSTLRIYYPDVNDLSSVTEQAKDDNPELTAAMVKYLKELVDAGQLVLHQTSISVPAEPASENDPYFYLVACPIHDDAFKRSLDPEGDESIINNGSMESYDRSNFYMGDPSTNGQKVQATITAGAGKDDSRGIHIATTAENNSNSWDTQFLIQANEVIPCGTTFHLEFDYKATNNATVSTQAHSTPGNYNANMSGNIGSLSFTNEWKHFSEDITVTDAMANGQNHDKHNSFQSIAFNLWQTQTANDYYFDNVELTVHKHHYVAYFCDEPQGLRVKVGQKAPRLQTGFVPGEHGFQTYNYNFPANTNPVLSIRLAKAAQFETVKNTEEEVADVSTDVNYLWLPIRNARTETADGVIKMSNDDNIYLASSTDMTWDKKIAKEMNKNGSLPVVGRIVELQAINTKDVVVDAVTGETHETNKNLDAQDAYNRLAVYFNKGFNVREGYNYTLSLPFQENEPDDEKRNVCDGTILINLKIVPDYEVWTGAAGNIDWNNDENWRRADGNTATNLIYDVYGDELYRANGAETNANSPLHTYTTNKDNYYSSSTMRTASPSSDQVLRKGFAPLYCTHVLMSSNEWGNAPELYDGLDYKEDPTNPSYLPANATLNAYPFPNLRETSTPILKFDMQARRWDLWEETYGVAPDRGNVSEVGGRPLPSTHSKDLIAEMYQINSCDEIAFQPGTEMRNAHLLNYNTAWVEYQLDNKRWYLLGSPLQGTISGEWYAPTGTAKQKTTYYDPVAFRPRYIKVTNPKPTDNPSERNWYKKNGDNYVSAGETAVDSETDYYYQYTPADYDRYSPAIYQRSWDKAKAVLYEVGSEYATTDDDQTDNLGSDNEGIWSSGSWSVEGGGTADEYLDRLGYKPMGGNKANVAIQGIWSNTYNDAQVDYATGGFSVMVMNHLKNNDQSQDNKSIIRLPKEDTMYDYYEFSQNNADDGETDTELSDVQTKDSNTRARNRGRLKADKMLPNKVTVTEVGETPSDVITSDITIKRQEKTASIYGDARDYTRVPTTEAPLQVMNGGDFTFTETIPAGVSKLGFYLVENPFPCGLDMAKFFAANSVTFTQDEIDNASEGAPAYGKTTNDVKSGLERKYWLLTKAAEGQNPRQVLVQLAPDGEWITSEGDAVDYQNPNYVAPGAGDTEPTEPATLQFYPHAVVAPGQGFFVQATGISDDLTVTFNRDMQAQSRFGMKDNEHGTPYTIVVGQAQVMEPLYIDVDQDGDGVYESREQVFVDVDLNGNGIYGETYTEDVEEDGTTVTKTIVEKEPAMVASYEKDEDTGEFKLDDEGNKIPILTDITEEVVIYKYVPETMKRTDNTTFDKEYPLLSRQTRGGHSSSQHGMVITAKRGADVSSALVMRREDASNDFLPSEDTESFINSDLKLVPTVYTLCGRLATTINSIQDFTCLPLGVESASDAPCTLTFEGVEQLGDSVAFYDAVERKLTPLESGKKIVVSGQTQNRYYLVRSLIQEEAAAETHLQIFTEGLTATVIASTEEPIDNVRCYDTAGRLVITAQPQTREYSFTLPQAGVYIIDAQTENDRKTKKVMAK